MSQEAWDERTTEPETVETFIKFTGTGAAPVTKVFGRGVATTRTGVGLVSLIWDEFPGVYMGVKGWCFEATTPADLKGFTVVPGVYNTTTRTLAISITNASVTLADLAALQQLSITVAFKRTSA